MSPHVPVESLNVVKLAVAKVIGQLEYARPQVRPIIFQGSGNLACMVDMIYYNQGICAA